jgi:hypothetical protein
MTKDIALRTVKRHFGKGDDGEEREGKRCEGEERMDKGKA